MQSEHPPASRGGRWSDIGVRQLALAIALLAGMGLSGCGLYLHDPALEASTTAAIKSVNDSDVSPQVTATLEATTQLAAKEEVAVVRFWTSQRNLEITNLLQPDPLERRYFTTMRKYAPSGSSYTRDAASLKDDIQQVVDCRLNALVGKDTSPAACLPMSTGADAAVKRDEAVNRNEADYQTLRIQSFTLLQSTDDQVDTARKDLDLLRENLAKEFKLHPSSTWERNFDFSCESAGKIDVEKLALDPAITSDDVGMAFVSFARGCKNLAVEIERAQPNLAADPGSLIGENRKVIASLIEEQKARDQTIVELKKQLDEIEAASSGAAPDQTKLEAAVTKIHKLLENATGAAKLAGLGALQDLLDKLTQIELDNVNKGETDAKEADPLTARGTALLKLADATEKAIEAYQGANSADKAQSLIIAAIAVQQKISVAQIENDLDRTKLRLRKGLDRLYSGEVRALAEAGLSMTQSDLKATSNHDAIVSIAASWDSFRIPGSVLEYREMQAEREAGIKISAVNAAETQKVIAAAMAAVDAYAKGGITEAQILDIISKFFIGGAILK